MNTTDLLYFYEVAETLHFGRAAQRLHITQPPLSRSIRRLEEELDVVLFNRNQRHVELTVAGEYLKKQAAALFGKMKEMETKVRSIAKGTEGELHITSVGSVVPFVMRFVKVFTARYPAVRIKISQYTTSEQIQMIKEGKADISFLRCPVFTGGLRLHTIRKENFVLVVPRTFKGEVTSQKDLKAVADMPFIMFPRSLGIGSYDLVLSMCSAAGFLPNIVHESYQLDIIVKMVEAGMGVTIIPECAVKGVEADVKCFDLEFMPQRSTVSCYFDERRDNPVLANFVEVVGVER